MLWNNDSFCPLVVGLLLVILLLMVIAMLALAENYPNNAALYLSVLGGLSTIVAIISFMVIVVDAHKTGSTSALSTGFLAWYILTALSMDFALAVGMVLKIEKMENNPYCIWNWREQS